MVTSPSAQVVSGTFSNTIKLIDRRIEVYKESLGNNPKKCEQMIGFIRHKVEEFRSSVALIEKSVGGDQNNQRSNTQQTTDTQYTSLIKNCHNKIRYYEDFLKDPSGFGRSDTNLQKILSTKDKTKNPSSPTTLSIPQPSGKIGDNSFLPSLSSSSSTPTGSPSSNDQSEDLNIEQNKLEEQIISTCKSTNEYSGGNTDEENNEMKMYRRGDGRIVLMDDTLDIYDQSIDKLKNIVALNDETLEIASKTGERLRQQTEKLQNIQKELDSVGQGIKSGKKLTGDLRRRIAGDLCIVLMIALLLCCILIIVGVKIAGVVLGCDVLTMEFIQNPNHLQQCPLALWISSFLKKIPL